MYRLVKSMFYGLTALAAFSVPASAATVAFTGTRSNADAPGAAAARCGPRLTISIRNSVNSSSTGMSNFGAFDPTLSHCILLPLPAPYDLGEFLFDFASGNTLSGTYSGMLTFNAPGIFNNVQNYVVTGGTGIFAGASGSFVGTGTLGLTTGIPRGEQSFRGSINAPAVPEAASWMMMIMGFGVVGVTLRRRKQAMSFA